jgi:hypothetical protein
MTLIEVRSFEMARQYPRTKIDSMTKQKNHAYLGTRRNPNDGIKLHWPRRIIDSRLAKRLLILDSPCVTSQGRKGLGANENHHKPSLPTPITAPPATRPASTAVAAAFSKSSIDTDLLFLFVYRFSALEN